MDHITRRRMLQGLGSNAVVASGLTGCLGRRSGGSPGSITVAYVPIYPNMQHFVMEAERYYEDVPIAVSVERFSAGPNVVKAFASGAVDVALFGITPAMVLTDTGTDGGILAVNARNGFKILATRAVVDLYRRAGPEMFEQFAAEHGRRIRFGVPPDGSVPDVVLRYWIQEDLGVGATESVIHTSTVPPAKAVQTIQSGAIDATIVQEPFATVITDSDAFGELAWSGSILESHPVTVLFANQRVIDATDVSQSLVAQHVTATTFIEESPAQATGHAAKAIGSGVTVSLARAAMESRTSDFVSNPHAITDQTEKMSEFVASVGTIDTPVATEELFAFDAYDAVQA